MKTEVRSYFAALLVAAASLFSGAAWATTQVVNVNSLNFATTLATPFNAGDGLIVDTVVTGSTGSLSQTITFTVGADVLGAFGFAAWEVSPGKDTGPLLQAVNIDVRDSSDTLVVSDTFNGVTGGFALSTLRDFPLLPGGTYKLVATGNAIRDTVLDISVNFAAVPEPATLTMLLGGLAVVGFALVRRRIGGAAA
jgi:hypothetical protein